MNRHLPPAGPHDNIVPMPTLRYRAAEQADIPALAAMNAALLEQYGLPAALGHAELEHRMTVYLSDGYQAVLFTWDEEPVGYCLYRLFPKYAHLRHFYVDRRVSKKVRLPDALALLRADELTDYASIRMDVPEGATDALGEWQSLGFRPRSVRLELHTARKRKPRKACGAVIYRKTLQGPLYLIVQHESGGHWSFPKGHMDDGETEMETARREIAEETGLQLGFREGFYERIYYLTPKDRRKEVVYFLSRARRPRVRVQPSEIRAFRWLPYPETRELLTYENTRLVLDKAHAFVAERGL